MVAEKTSAGDSPRKGPLNSRIWNRVVEGSDDHQSRKALAEVVTPPPGLEYSQHSWVKVENTCGADVREGEVLEFTGSAVTELFNRKLMLTGVNPNLERVGWGITLQPIKAGEINRILLVGACIGQVNIVSEDHKYAERVSGSRVLRSASSGPVKILHKPTGGTPPEERECIVQLADEVGEGTKIVEASNILYAAFGGEGCYYASVASNALAISTGNFVPYTAPSGSTPATGTAVQRKVYPALCQVQELDSDNNLRATGQYISVFNPDSLPIHGGYWHVSKHSGDLYTIVSPYGNHQHNSGGFFTSQGSQTFSHGETKLITNSWSVQSNTTNTSNKFLYAVGGSLFITHPGYYKITYGGMIGISSEPVNQYTTSGGHTVQVPTAARATLSLWTNFNPAFSDIEDQYDNHDQVSHAGIIIPPSAGDAYYSKSVVEKTVHITTSLDNWHGQPYTRLNLSLSCDADGTYSDGSINFRHVWINVTAMGGYGQQPMGSGYNAFLGTSGAFQWWGGGDEPGILDEDGDWV